MLGMASPAPVAGTTPLTVYVTKTRTANAAKLTTSATTTTTPTHLGGQVSGTGGRWYGIAFGAGATPNTSATEIAPNGRGAVWAVTTLTGHHIVAGKWTFTLHLGFTTGTTVLTGTLHVRAYRRNGSTYVQIGSDLTKSVSLVSTVALVNLTATLAASGTFATGTRLYVDAQIFRPAGGGAAMTKVPVGLTTAKIKTPGYA